MPDKFNLRLQKHEIPMPDVLLYVNTHNQSLVSIQNQNISRTYTISTSQYGIGSENGSFKTPPGIHRITDKIGSDAPIGRVFRNRKDTGLNWNSTLSGDNQILTRIMRLEGMELGINKGQNIDSYERYIYIHGTNREDLIGTPLSHGCICMANKDIIELFNTIREGTIVIID